MANDDLVRVVYRPKRMGEQGVAGKAAAPLRNRRNRTSISMDPDLYETFVLIVGDAREARAQLRRWATEVDRERCGKVEATGVSRLVHKRMLARIREVVEAGLTVIRAEASAARGSAAVPAVAGPSDWDTFRARAAARPVDRKRSPSKAQAGADVPAATVQCLDDADIDEAVGVLADLLGSPQRGEPLRVGRLPPQHEYTREREISDDAAAEP